MQKTVIRLILTVILLPAVGCSAIVDELGGDFAGEPSEMDAALSPLARELVERAYQRIDVDRIVDHHVHVAGSGSPLDRSWPGFGATGCYFNPELSTWWHPINRARTAVFMDAAGITEIGRADQQFAERLLELVQHVPHGRFLILALDFYCEEDGSINRERTDFHIPDDYVLRLAAALNEKLGRERFVAVGSIHPYRPDALERLAELHARGVRHIKWLPNAMNIDPASSRCFPFYEKMAELKMVLLCHTGWEDTAAVYGDNQRLGNPLLLEAALERGVTVVMSHCGRSGESVDLHDPEGGRRPNFELFLDMMTLEKYRKYEGQLFGDISACTVPATLNQLLRIVRDERLRGRIVNGSDYPIPAFHVLGPTGKLLDLGAITAEEADALDEIYSYNPLLFDFVVKRTLRDPETGQRIPAAFFLELRSGARTGGAADRESPAARASTLNCPGPPGPSIR